MKTTFGAFPPYEVLMTRHFCNSRVAFTAGTIVDATGVPFKAAEKVAEWAAEHGWCKRGSNRDGSPHPGRGRFFYIGNL